MLAHNWLAGMLGALLGALIGGFVVWLTRILGTLGFGRVAMGLGDVHLMFGVGAIIGAGAATIAFFIAPFFGIAIAIYMLLTGTRRELPYGPYLVWLPRSSCYGIARSPRIWRRGWKACSVSCVRS